MESKLIAVCTGASLSNADRYREGLSLAMDRYGIAGRRAAMFLANVGHESGHLSRVVENLNYRVDALLKSFGRHRIGEAEARAYGRTETRPADQVAIANCLYGGLWGKKNLGNTEAGDGWRFRGAGLIQSTGRGNARRLTERLAEDFPELDVPDFEDDPDALQEPLWAALSAGSFWDAEGLNVLADEGDFDGVCDKINMGRKTAADGDAKGYEDRRRLMLIGARALGL